MVDQYLHTHAGHNQIHLEWSSRDRRGFVAVERIWTVSLVDKYQSWPVGSADSISCTILPAASDGSGAAKIGLPTTK